MKKRLNNDRSVEFLIFKNLFIYYLVLITIRETKPHFLHIGNSPERSTTYQKFKFYKCMYFSDVFIGNNLK